MLSIRHSPFIDLRGLLFRFAAAILLLLPVLAGAGLIGPTSKGIPLGYILPVLVPTFASEIFRGTVASIGFSAVALALIVGAATILGASLSSPVSAFILGLVYGLGPRFILNFVQRMNQRSRIDWSGTDPVVLRRIKLFSWILTVLTVVLVTYQFGYFYGSGLLTGACAAIGTLLGQFMADYAATQLSFGLTLFSLSIVPYVRSMANHIIGFLLGYSFIIVWFAGVYSAAYVMSGTPQFTGVPSGGNFGNFLYFSATTISNLGYSEIRPASDAFRFIGSVESIIGLGWVVVVFSAVIASLGPIFNAATTRRQDEVQQVILESLKEQQQQLNRIAAEQQRLAERRIRPDDPELPNNLPHRRPWIFWRRP